MDETELEDMHTAQTVDELIDLLEEYRELVGGDTKLYHTGGPESDDVSLTYSSGEYDAVPEEGLIDFY